MQVARSLVIAALVLSACSGDDDTATTATTSTAPITSAPATTSAAVPASTASTTTAPPAVTSAPDTSAAATTPAGTVPATLSPDPAQVQGDVIAAVIAAWQAYIDAARDPMNEEKLAALAVTLSGPKLELSVQNIAGLVASGRIAVENPTTPAAIDVYDETVMVDATAGTASVEFCRIGSDLGIVPGGNPDGTDQVVVNEVNAYHERSELVFANGRWTDHGGEVIARFPGTSVCA